MPPAALISCVLCVLASVATSPEMAAAGAPEIAPTNLGTAADTLIPTGIKYKGYRLHVRDAKLVRQRRGRYLIEVTVVNTGARAIGLGPGFPVHFLQTAFDGALAQSGLLPLAPGIRRGIIEARLTLEPGEVAERLSFWATADERTVLPAGGTDEFEVAERQPLRKRRPEDRTQPIYASAKPIITPQQGASTTACVDLVVAAVEVVARDRRSATIRVVIANRGDLPLTAASIGTGASLDLYLGGGAEITAASQRLARVNLSARLGPSLREGLTRDATLAVTERVSLSTLTRYTRVVVAQLDPGQEIEECDETNNEESVVLKS